MLGCVGERDASEGGGMVLWGGVFEGIFPKQAVEAVAAVRVIL